jgi:hypothetical protein
VLKVLAEMGESQITEINIVREPLSEGLTNLLNRVSLGEFQKKLHDLPYDNYHMKLPREDLFYLFMEITTAEGKYILEKNAVISVAIFSVLPERCEKKSVRLRLGDITMNQMLNDTRKFMADEKFFGYKAPTNNCQDFLFSILKSNLMSTALIEEFIFQNSERVFNNSKEFRLLARNIAQVDTISRLLSERKFQLLKKNKENIKMQKKKERHECTLS